MTSTATVLPTAPPCPSWCTEHPAVDHGWEIQGRDLVKMCTALVGTVQTENGGPIELMVQRFAWVDGGTVTVEGPYVCLQDRFLTLTEAAALAEALRSARGVALEEITN